MTTEILIAGYGLAMAISGWYEYEDKDFRDTATFKAFRDAVKGVLSAKPQNTRQIKERLRKAGVEIRVEWLLPALDSLTTVKVIERYPCDLYYITDETPRQPALRIWNGRDLSKKESSADTPNRG